MTEVVFADELKVSTRQGKVIVHEMLFGASVPPDRATSSFLLEFQKLSLYLRCFMLAQVMMSGQMLSPMTPSVWSRPGSKFQQDTIFMYA